MIMPDANLTSDSGLVVNLPPHRLGVTGIQGMRNLVPLPQGVFRRRWGSKHIEPGLGVAYTTVADLEDQILIFADDTWYRTGTVGNIFWSKAGSAVNWTSPEMGPDATVYGAPSYPSGQFGKATDFAANASNYATVPSALYSYERGTVAMHFYYSDAEAASDGALWSVNHGAYAQALAGMCTDGTIVFFLLGEGEITYAHGWSSPGDDGWKHVGFVWDVDGIGGGADTMQLWLDGTEVDDTSASLAELTEFFSPFYIGLRQREGQACGLLIDDVMIRPDCVTDFTGWDSEGGLV